MAWLILPPMNWYHIKDPFFIISHISYWYLEHILSICSYNVVQYIWWKETNYILCYSFIRQHEDLIINLLRKYHDIPTCPLFSLENQFSFDWRIKQGLDRKQKTNQKGRRKETTIENINNVNNYHYIEKIYLIGSFTKNNFLHSVYTRY